MPIATNRIVQEPVSDKDDIDFIGRFGPVRFDIQAQGASSEVSAQQLQNK